MAHWYYEAGSKDKTHRSREVKFAQLLYKAVIAYLNREARGWKDVVAKLNLVDLEPLYNVITINGALHYADQSLINECYEILARYNEFTFYDQPVARITIDFNRQAKLGSFGYEISYAAS